MLLLFYLSVCLLASHLWGAPKVEAAGQLVSIRKEYRLPGWFNFDLYKQFYGKHYERGNEDELHRRAYLATALKVFERRALFRAGRLEALSSVNELSDLTARELRTLRSLRGRAEVTPAAAAKAEPEPLPACCTRDQVYSGLIELLNKSSSQALSGAYVEELEQRPLLKSIWADHLRKKGESGDLAEPDAAKMLVGGVTSAAGTAEGAAPGTPNGNRLQPAGAASANGRGQMGRQVMEEQRQRYYQHR